MSLVAKNGSQCRNSTLLWNGTDTCTDFNLPSGLNFTGCDSCEFGSGCCMADPAPGLECNTCMSYGMSLYMYCLCKR